MAANDKKTTKQTLERVKAWANQEFVRNTVNNLVNYYLKSETYTKAEVQQLLNAIKQFTYQVVPSLPTASADTMNVIYLVPTEDPKTKNVKDEFITIDNGAGAATRYTWEQIGSTQIDLSGYYTSAQTDAAITAALNSALANYTTTANLNTLLSGKVDKVSGKGLSTNDYTNEEKAKLGALPTEAELNNEFAISGVYDVSAKNPTAGPNSDGKWESLSALLNDERLSTLIPTDVRKGGMTLKFVCSSDNKYVQYFCNYPTFTTDVEFWEKINIQKNLEQIIGDNAKTYTAIVGNMESIVWNGTKWVSTENFKTLIVEVHNNQTGKVSTSAGTILQTKLYSEKPTLNSEITALNDYTQDSEFINNSGESRYIVVSYRYGGDYVSPVANISLSQYGIIGDIDDLENKEISQDEEIDELSAGIGANSRVYVTGDYENISWNGTKFRETTAWKSFIIPLKKGQTLSFSSKDTISTRNVFLVEPEIDVVASRYAEIDYHTNTYTADCDCYALISFSSVIDTPSLYVHITGTGVYIEIDKLKPLYAKNIVCFGDSLTEMTDLTYGMHYSDYIAEFTEANIINVGIGGSEIRQRSKLTTVFSATTQYHTDDFVLYRASEENTYGWYKFTNDHIGAWDSNDVELKTSGYEIYAQLDIVSLIKAVVNNSFDDVMAVAEYIRDVRDDDNTPQIKRLMSIDWSKVDYVTVFAGTNDWADAWFTGTTGSTDITTTLGAINVIIKDLLSVYKNIKLYWFTPIVRWLSYSQGTGTDANWSDVYEKYPSSTPTLKTLSQSIYDEVKLNHIPVCDLYNTLGINKYNFSNYFEDNDGTHPRKYAGVKLIADKIERFLLSD